MNLEINKYDALIKGYLDGQGTPEETLELLSWVAESEENRTYFKAQKDAKEVWSLTDFAMPEPDDIDVEVALNAVNMKIDAMEEGEATTIEMSWVRRNYKYVSGIAAALVVALFLGFLVTKPFNSNITVASNAQNPVEALSLPDGTSVTFGGDGKITYPKQFAKSTRQIDFEGIAVFDVAKDENQPFVIHCNNMDVEVLGTSFLLNAGNGRSFLDLYSGKVKMTSFDHKGNALAQMEIKPGERGVWNAEGELRMMTYPEVREEQLRLEHVLVFDNASLSSIVETLEYIFNIRINLDSTCADKKITARFTDKDPIDEVLETIAVVSNVTVTKKNGIYSIQ